MSAHKKIIFIFGCLTIFFPGAFVFGFPGVMAQEWTVLFSVNKAQIGRSMFFILAGTGFSMILAGKLQQKISPRYIILMGSFFTGAAMFFVGQATCMEHIYVWGFIEGFFSGFIYIPCLTLFQQMFWDHKGLATGIFNLTFGGSAAIMSPLFTYLLVSKGYAFTSSVAGAISLLLGTSLAGFIKLPGPAKNEAIKSLPGVSMKTILRLKPFWFLWGVWALSGAAGISLIVLSASFGFHLGYEIAQSVMILTCFNIFNGLGRLVCGRLSDHYAKQHILMTIFLMAAGAYLLMPWFSHVYGVSFLACFIGIAFGGMFTVSAPLVTEVFGLENFGLVLGMVFTAYGFLAGFLGPWLSGIILDITRSNYTMVFSIFSGFYLVSSLMILKVKT